MLRKESVIGSLINIHYNRDFIKDVPFIPVGEDFAVIFKYYLYGTTDGSATITITDSLAELMGLDESMLLRLALQNTPRIYPLEFSPLTEMVNRLIQKGDLCSEFPDASDLSDAENEVPMHILTNTRNEFGAFALFYPETAKTLFDTLEDDLILIPSSVSEWIIMPYSQAGIAPFLESMIQEVNHEHVAPQEILGDRAYFLKRDSRDIFQQLIPLSEAC